MTKIVLVAHRFLPRFIGGVELYTLRLAHIFQQLGHHVHILTGEPRPGLGFKVVVEEDEVQALPRHPHQL